MNDFVYYIPTKVVFGKGSEKKVGELIRQQGCNKVLIHFGGGSVVRSGLLGRIRQALSEEGIAFTELGGVVPNPHIALVYEGIELAKKEKVDFILAVGGGSVIDSAKAIGYGVASGGDVWDFYEKTRTPDGCLPIGCVLTIAAAGSEMSTSSIMTNEKTGEKRPCSMDFARPVFAVMDPELTMTLPAYQTSCGCTDIMMHAMERYFTHGDNMDVTDGIGESLMRNVMKYAHVLMDEPQNYRARAEIMWAGSLCHNGLTDCGTSGGDFATHKLEHELSGMFDVTHGAGLAALWPSWARYVYQERPERFRKFAVNVMGIEDSGSDDKIINKGIEAIEQFYREIHMPINMKELGIEPTDEQIEEMAEKCNDAFPGLGRVKHLNKEDMIAIYTMAR